MTEHIEINKDHVGKTFYRCITAQNVYLITKLSKDYYIETVTPRNYKSENRTTKTNRKYRTKCRPLIRSLSFPDESSVLYYLDNKYKTEKSGEIYLDNLGH